MSYAPEHGYEAIIFGGDLTSEEARQLLVALIDHLGLIAYRTNRTKHGHQEIKVERTDQ